MKILVIEEGKRAYAKEIDGTLHSLQELVDGYIEAIYPFDDPVALICNEEGKLIGLPLNRALRDEDNEIYDIIAGTFLVVGIGDESFTGLTPELEEKYTERFGRPELFFKIAQNLISIPYDPE